MVYGQPIGGVQQNPLVANLTPVQAPGAAPPTVRPQDAAFALRFPDTSRAEVLSTAEAELRLVVPAIERLETKAAAEGLTTDEAASLGNLKTQAQAAMNRYALSAEGGAALRASGLVPPGSGLEAQVAVAEAYARGAQDLATAETTSRISVPEAATRLRAVTGDADADRVIDNAIATASLRHIPESVVSGDQRYDAVVQLGGGGQRAYIDATKNLRSWWQPPGMARDQLEARGTAGVLQEASLIGVHPRDQAALEYGATVATGRELLPEAYSEIGSGVLGIALGPSRRAAQSAVGEGAEQAVEQGARQVGREAGQRLALEAPGSTAAIRRASPGTATGAAQLRHVEGPWLRGSQGNFGTIPRQVAEALEGREFANFGAFREAFWKETTRHPELTAGMSRSNITRMEGGLAPVAPRSQHHGGQTSYVLHHNTPIHDGGGVYSMDNLSVVTPRLHQDMLYPGYHFGR